MQSKASVKAAQKKLEDSRLVILEALARFRGGSSSKEHDDSLGNGESSAILHDDLFSELPEVLQKKPDESYTNGMHVDPYSVYDQYSDSDSGSGSGSGYGSGADSPARNKVKKIDHHSEGGIVPADPIQVNKGP